MSQLRRVRENYSKSGCLGCKFRKKKCDERRPTCLACERNVLICTWPKSRKSENQQEGKQEREQQEQHVHSGVGQSSSTGLTSDPRLGLSLRTNSTALNHSVSRLLWSHYVQTLAKHCPLPDQWNPFLTRLLPMAQSNEVMMQALLSFSGAHYPNKSASINEMTWIHYGQAVRGLKFALTNFHKNEGRDVDAVALMFSSWFLLITETQGNRVSVDAFHHLKAIRAFLDMSLKENRLDATMRGFLVEIYMYSAIIGDFSMMAFSDEWKCKDADLLLSMPTPGILCGCAQSLFATIPTITAFANDLALERELWMEREWIEREYSLDSTARYNLILQEVLRWSAPSQTIDPAWSLLGEIYKQALLLCLHVSFYQHTPGSWQLPELVQDCINQGIALCTQVPLDSPINTTICWPLVVLGSCARSTPDREFVLERLQNTYESLSYGNLLETKAFLAILWAERDANQEDLFMGPLDIQDALRRQHRSFVFV